jgi:hypothetical protein
VAGKEMVKQEYKTCGSGRKKVSEKNKLKGKYK